MFGEFPRHETITGMRQAFEKETGKLAVSHNALREAIKQYKADMKKEGY